MRNVGTARSLALGCAIVSYGRKATSTRTMQSNAIQAVFAITALAMNAAAAQAAQIGSIEQGLTLAREQCAECHLIGREKGLSTNEKAPTFARVANTPGMTAAALRTALNTSHRSMPNLIIKGDDADSIIAYILSLRDGQ